jgi:hypothetical protein
MIMRTAVFAAASSRAWAADPGAGGAGIRKPLIGRRPLCFRQGIIRLERIVDDDDTRVTCPMA